MTYALLVCGVILATPLVYARINRDVLEAAAGERLFLAGQYDQATQRFARAMALGDLREGLLKRLGEAALASGNFTLAAEAYGSLAERYPKNRMAPVKLAEMLALNGRSDEALAQVGQVLTRHPGDRPALAMRARILTIAGRFDDAIRDYRTLLNEPQGE